MKNIERSRTETKVGFTDMTASSKSGKMALSDAIPESVGAVSVACTGCAGIGWAG